MQITYLCNLYLPASLTYAGVACVWLHNPANRFGHPGVRRHCTALQLQLHCTALHCTSSNKIRLRLCQQPPYSFSYARNSTIDRTCNCNCNCNCNCKSLTALLRFSSLTPVCIFSQFSSSTHPPSTSTPPEPLYSAPLRISHLTQTRESLPLPIIRCAPAILGQGRTQLQLLGMSAGENRA